MSAFAVPGHPTLEERFFEAFEGGDPDCCACEARAIAVHEIGRTFVCPRCRKEWVRILDEDGGTGWEEA